MKKIFKSRGFIISTLAVLCIVILGICWYANRERTEAFVPDESPPSTQSQPMGRKQYRAGIGNRRYNKT